MSDDYSDEEFRQHLADAYESLKNTYNEAVPEAFTSEFAEKLKERLAKPDPFSTGFKIGKPITIPKGALDSVIEEAKKSEEPLFVPVKEPYWVKNQATECLNMISQLLEDEHREKEREE